jgi:G3E family GTPase
MAEPRRHRGAPGGAASLDRFAEAARQVALADTLVISKTDLAPYGPQLVCRLDRLNPAAPRLFAKDSLDPGVVLFEGGEPPHPSATRTPSPACGGGLGRGPAPDAAHSHGIDAFAVILDGPMTRFDFARALGKLAGARGTGMLRVKGIVGFADRPERPALVQAAQHTLFAPEWLARWPADWPAGDRRGRLVFVVHDIPRSEILEHFAFALPMLMREPL